MACATMTWSQARCEHDFDRPANPTNKVPERRLPVGFAQPVTKAPDYDLH